MRGRFDTSDGVSLAYEDDGAGLPVLCLPGLTRNARDFDDLAAALDRPVRLMRLTARGRGDSGWADPASYTVPVEARDAVELLDHLGIARAVIIGTSRGGLVAMLLARMAGDRLAGVVLNDIGPEVAPDGMARIMGYLGRRPAGRTWDDGAAALEADQRAQFPGVPLARWRVMAERLFVAAADGLDLRYDARLRDTVAAVLALPPVDLWPMFAALDGVPLALVRGANSDLLARETADRMAALHPGMIRAEVPDRGHVPFLDEPESLAAIHALLDRVAP